ncbi:hypothetical protein QDT91_28500 (plasmid) [Mycolicibacterium aubagnense]|uniref:hypothetical protein n=1 Tax=Mycolicibacterium aubagnense TaxID=319707 RepID=UPI0013F67FEB|nr:hypothetical protein [Mycolicibacterium aubagnense]WGI35950.1 hypothetical protein QDT91_28500 [Mycolicibacterium aubagnense]
MDQNQPEPALDTTSQALARRYSNNDLVRALRYTGAIDPTALSDTLRTKATTLGDDLTDIDASLARRRGVRFELVGCGIVFGFLARIGALLAVINMVIVLGQAMPITSAGLDELARHLITSAIAAVSLGLTSLGCSRLAKTRSYAYTETEAAELRTAAVDWPCLWSDLDDYPNQQALHTAWSAQGLPATGEPGSAALVWREPRLVAIAHLVAADIRASRAWKSPLTTSIRIDLDSPLLDIELRAYRIWHAHANLVPTPAGDTDSALAKRNAEITTAADRAWDTLVELVRQLIAYHDQLASMGLVLKEIEDLQLSTIRTNDNAVRQLYIDAAANEMDTDAVREATAQLADLTEALRARKDYLRTVLSEPTSLLALTT